MILPPMGIGVVGVKPMVNVTMDLDTTRSDDIILNETAVTCPTMAPEGTGEDGAVSTEVCTKISAFDGFCAIPILKPLNCRKVSLKKRLANQANYHMMHNLSQTHLMVTTKGTGGIVAAAVVMTT